MGVLIENVRELSYHGFRAHRRHAAIKRREEVVSDLKLRFKIQEKELLEWREWWCQQSGIEESNRCLLESSVEISHAWLAVHEVATHDAADHIFAETGHVDKYREAVTCAEVGCQTETLKELKYSEQEFETALEAALARVTTAMEAKIEDRIQSRLDSLKLTQPGRQDKSPAQSRVSFSENVANEARPHAEQAASSSHHEASAERLAGAEPGHVESAGTPVAPVACGVREPFQVGDCDTAVHHCFETGDYVELQGLQSQAQLNGQRGHLANFLAKTQRWEVYLDTAGAPVHAREANLVKLPPAWLTEECESDSVAEFDSMKEPGEDELLDEGAVAYPVLEAGCFGSRLDAGGLTRNSYGFRTTADGHVDWERSGCHGVSEDVQRAGAREDLCCIGCRQNVLSIPWSYGTAFMTDDGQTWEEKCVIDFLDDPPRAVRCHRCQFATIPCKYYTQGHCGRGAGCAYKH